MHAVHGQSGLHGSALGREDRPIVHVADTSLLGIGLDPVVDAADTSKGVEAGMPVVIGGGRDGSQGNLNVVWQSQLDDRFESTFDLFVRFGTIITSYIDCAGHDVNQLRL